MSNASQASVTNQKLDAARRFLQQSQQCEEAWLLAGLEGASLFHLRSALNGLLQEVKTAYSLKSELDILKLQHAAKEEGVVVPTLSELSDLALQPHSWLNQLEQAFLAQLECHYTSFSSMSLDNIIGKGSDAGASVGLYLSKLVELVLRFREESSEY
ncbi:hypothetical protein MSP8887_02959 [Marinomonas spartinae]|uniref:DUF6586 family protein n=1 Tax=Marinomonas spartinae TaxID=1792290 RepID=UPI000808F4BC|nr:DUF6586 family protein [Marinomonas spartinae]SBS37531.1 hypothetical protein MSP8887_02959 [Marinomonas spartinae]